MFYLKEGQIWTFAMKLSFSSKLARHQTTFGGKIFLLSLHKILKIDIKLFNCIKINFSFYGKSKQKQTIN